MVSYSSKASNWYWCSGRGCARRSMWYFRIWSRRSLLTLSNFQHDQPYTPSLLVQQMFYVFTTMLYISLPFAHALALLVTSVGRWGTRSNHSWLPSWSYCVRLVPDLPGPGCPIPEVTAVCYVKDESSASFLMSGRITRLKVQQVARRVRTSEWRDSETWGQIPYVIWRDFWKVLVGALTKREYARDSIEAESRRPETFIYFVIEKHCLLQFVLEELKITVDKTMNAQEIRKIAFRNRGSELWDKKSRGSRASIYRKGVQRGTRKGDWVTGHRA